MCQLCHMGIFNPRNEKVPSQKPKFYGSVFFVNEKLLQVQLPALFLFLRFKSYSF